MNLAPSDQRKNKAAIYIPAYNAESTILTVLERIPKRAYEMACEIFIVDNCSSDKTSEVALRYRDQKRIANLNVIRNERNEGYGGSQKIAYTHCIRQGYDAVAMLHGDAQYAPELVEQILQPVLEGSSQLVFGSRMSGNPLKGGMPLHRFAGNRVLTCFQNFLLNQNLSEYHSGYRAYSIKALQAMDFSRLSDDYHFDTEIIILMIHHGFRISETTIPTFYGSEKNYVNIWKYGSDVLVTTLSYALHRSGIRSSRNWARILAPAAASRTV